MICGVGRSDLSTTGADGEGQALRNARHRHHCALLHHVALTYVGVAELDHVFLNVNRFYMAVVMVAPTVIVMLTDILERLG